jgi:triosephosphate isomerase
MTNKLKYFVGNWKMFGDFNSFQIIKRIAFDYQRIKAINKKNKIIICIPSVLIAFFNSKLRSKSLLLGAQNCSQHKDYGPYTGSISATMLRKAGAEYVILGHSENRLEGETNNLIKKKIISAQDQNLSIILCIGETLSDKNKKRTFAVLKKQIISSIDNKSDFKKIIIAYEPVLSIGTGRVPDSHELKKTFIFIKKLLKAKFKIKIKPSVIYGGSVNDVNIKKFSLIDEIDGFLIGGASQSSKKFIDIIKNYYK